MTCLGQLRFGREGATALSGPGKKAGPAARNNASHGPACRRASWWGTGWYIPAGAISLSPRNTLDSSFPETLTIVVALAILKCYGVLCFACMCSRGTLHHSANVSHRFSRRCSSLNCAYHMSMSQDAMKLFHPPRPCPAGPTSH